mgnify:CR=1 FL=1
MSMKEKLAVTVLVTTLALFGLVVVLYRMIKDKNADYTQIVLNQHSSYDSRTIPYRRGDIVDRNGTYLATSEKVYNLILDPNQINQDKDNYLEPTVSALCEVFGYDRADLMAVISANENSYYVPYEKQISADKKEEFEAKKKELNDAYAKSKDDSGKKVKGVWFEDEYRRFYPYNTLACNVIGFSYDNGKQGSGGIEQYYNDQLTGTNGREYGYLNDDANLERTIKPAVDGNTIHSTIDANIQGIVEKYLKQFNEEHKDAVHPGNGAENVGCIIMEVNTGNILAMASYPTYDLNDTRNTDALLGSRKIEMVTNANGYQVLTKTDTYFTQEDIDALTDEQLLDNLNYLWKNYCISTTYEPGSTAKPFTVAAALESGAITGNEHYQCNGSLEVGGHTIKCHSYRSGGEGDVSVQDSIAWSCNVALMKIAATMGKEEFAKFQQIFNFGLKTNVDLAGEARTASLLFPVDQMGSADLATNSFGQNFNVTMIQMITGFCSLINGGYYYEPHMVDKITNASGATVENIEPRVLRQTISESTSAKIRQYCRATVMEEGGDRRTGRTARPAGYAIGGKTGTAETIPRKNGEYVVSFMGYAPADDPQIAIYVVVDRANASPQDDAKFATGIVRNVLTEVLPYLNIFMTEELSEKEIQELAEKQIEITNQYTQTPENGDDQSTGDNQTGDAQTGDAQTGDDQSGDSQSGDGTGDDTTTVTEDWRNYPKDPATGYLVSPIDGGLIDPITGADVGGDDTMGDSPINNNLLNQQNE